MLVDVPKMLAKLGITEYKAVRGELWAPCPLPHHPEGTASWSIVCDPQSPKHGLYKCFGCKRAGNPVTLVATIIGITNGGAARWLQDEGCMLDNQTPDTLPGRVRCEVLDGREPELELPPGVVTGRPFPEWPQIVRRYLVRRGITAWQVRAHGLGYAVSGEQGARLVIPVRNQYGRLLYYTGRSFACSQLRYRSADDQPGARPKAALFGESLWRTRPVEECFCAEGAIKVLAIERALCSTGTGEGGLAISAFSGAEMHEEQVLKLRRFERITYVRDPGETGARFAHEVERSLCGLGSAVRVVTPPGDEEADTLTRRELRALLLGEEGVG